MTHRVLNKHKAKSTIQIYCDVMKTIQCAHPPHHQNGLVRHAGYGRPVAEFTQC